MKRFFEKKTNILCKKGVEELGDPGDTLVTPW